MDGPPLRSRLQRTLDRLKCRYCRTAKKKCIRRGPNGFGPCERCQSRNLPCASATTAREDRATTDSRIKPDPRESSSERPPAASGGELQVSRPQTRPSLLPVLGSIFPLSAHKGIPPIVCLDCWRSFVSIQSLGGHIETHLRDDDGIAYACWDCGVGSQTFGLLQSHRNNPMPVCGGTSSIVNFAVNSLGTPEQVSWGCGQALSSHSDLRHHLDSSAYGVCWKSLWEAENKIINSIQSYLRLLALLRSACHLATPSIIFGSSAAMPSQRQTHGDSSVTWYEDRPVARIQSLHRPELHSLSMSQRSGRSSVGTYPTFRLQMMRSALPRMPVQRRLKYTLDDGLSESFSFMSLRAPSRGSSRALLPASSRALLPASSRASSQWKGQYSQAMPWTGRFFDTPIRRLVTRKQHPYIEIREPDEKVGVDENGFIWQCI
ncbi:hypothetical protein B0H63DRAFT_476672 [Podospora didyma]|uniref:Zn(2)-C6 fungal-type domain-containing protein n=1 Tax=Podospora didyma TaxID=330526 RepID=A0AAE0NHU2_9PEZI|nr:hypothetical protein B0H63DRAFT_476672 [Podospora didyma]